MDALGRKTCGAMRTVKPCGSGSPMLESTASAFGPARRAGDGG